MIVDVSYRRLLKGGRKSVTSVSILTILYPMRSKAIPSEWNRMENR